MPACDSRFPEAPRLNRDSPCHVHMTQNPILGPHKVWVRVEAGVDKRHDNIAPRIVWGRSCTFMESEDARGVRWMGIIAREQAIRLPERMP